VNAECYSEENMGVYGRIHPRSAKLLVITHKLSQDVRTKSSIVSFRSALLKPPGPVENNF